VPSARFVWLFLDARHLLPVSLSRSLLRLPLLMTSSDDETGLTDTSLWRVLRGAQSPREQFAATNPNFTITFRTQVRGSQCPTRSTTARTDHATHSFHSLRTHLCMMQASPAPHAWDDLLPTRKRVLEAKAQM
jgi:hypothetical protein